MLNLSLAGNLGRDAEYKENDKSTGRCSFPVAVNVGFGENKSTVWIDVTKWGAGAMGLSKLLQKGAKVAVSGEMSTREYNGKTYIQCRANEVTIMSLPQDREDYDGRNPAPNNKAMKEALDDEIPF